MTKFSELVDTIVNKDEIIIALLEQDQELCNAVQKWLMANKRRKLFVWNVTVNHAPGVAFAHAPDVETARNLLLGGDRLGTLHTKGLEGEPTEVFEENGGVIWRHEHES